MPKFEHKLYHNIKLEGNSPGFAGGWWSETPTEWTDKVIILNKEEDECQELNEN